MTSLLLAISVFRRFKKPSHLLTTSLIAGTLGIVGLPASTVPGTMPLMATSAIAQSGITADEITQYARAVLEMDGYRAEAYTEIKNLLLEENVDVSEISMTCTGIQETSQLPRSVRRNVQKILIGYCNQAQDIVESNGLTPRRFNEITDAHQQNVSLSEQIKQELIRLQQPQ